METAIRRDTAPAYVAELLDITTSDQTVIRARHMYDGERLVQLADSYVPVDVAEAAGVENPDPGLGGIISRMRDAGFEQTEAIEEITQYPATSVEAEAFGVEVGSQLLQITHTGYTKTGRAVEVTVPARAPAGRRGAYLRLQVAKAAEDSNPSPSPAGPPLTRESRCARALRWRS
ncbi:UTRA domain-containing protein [Streptomyces sp. L2]|uniref:UTRA domain-containing protein n=1 Tax=Streptomyces sp. L2 TaxID=2162665 RepID=UPI001F50CBFF|nr:UTRA domain-containing protein [Streptomyces sp. L2]